MAIPMNARQYASAPRAAHQFTEYISLQLFIFSNLAWRFDNVSWTKLIQGNRREIFKTLNFAIGRGSLPPCC